MCDRWRKYEELIRTGEEEKLAKLVRRKEDINAESGPLKKTLVHLVAEHGHVELLMQLLAREANLSVVSMIGDTPAHLAARNGHDRMMRFLGDNDFAAQDLNAQRPDGDAPIHFAALAGHIRCMDVLVEFTSHPDHPVDLNITNNNGSTPAHLAALKGHVAVMRALHEGEADCNLANKKDNMTPLDWAIRNQQVEMVAYLKSLGFRPTPPPPPPPAPAVGDDAAGGGKKKKGKKKKK